MKLRMVLMLLHRWVRTGEEGRDGCAVLMSNGDEGSVLILVFDERNSWCFWCRYKSMEVGKVHTLICHSHLILTLQLQEHAGEEWRDVLGWHPGVVVINEDGWGVFRCPASSVSIWVKNNAIGKDEFQGN
jgi:alpha-amylase